MTLHSGWGTHRSSRALPLPQLQLPTVDPDAGTGSLSAGSTCRSVRPFTKNTPCRLLRPCSCRNPRPQLRSMMARHNTDTDSTHRPSSAPPRRPRRRAFGRVVLGGAGLARPGAPLEGQRGGGPRATRAAVWSQGGGIRHLPHQAERAAHRTRTGMASTTDGGSSCASTAASAPTGNTTASCGCRRSGGSSPRTTGTSGGRSPSAGAVDLIVLILHPNRRRRGRGGRGRRVHRHPERRHQSNRDRGLRHRGRYC